MTSTLPPHNGFPGVNWRLFGERTLPDESAAREQVRAWLVNTLRPLHLSERLLERICVSAQPAGSSGPEHIHLMIFVPVEGPASGRNWGFFRMEKRVETLAGELTPEHAIAFYLYLEGR